MADKLVKAPGWLGPKGEFYYAGGHKTHQTALYEIIEDFNLDPELWQADLVDLGWIRIDYSYIMFPQNSITKRQFDDLRHLWHIKSSTISNREIHRVLCIFRQAYLEPGSKL